MIAALALAASISIAAPQMAEAPPPVEPTSLIPPSAAPLPGDNRVEHWYGGPTLLIDGAAIALFVVGELSGTQIPAYVAAAAFGLDGPIVHLLNGEPNHLIWSTVMRAGTLGVGLIGSLAIAHQKSCGSQPGDTTPRSSSCNREDAALAALPLLTVLIDDVFLSHTSTSGRQLILGPVVSFNSALFSLGGTF